MAGRLLLDTSRVSYEVAVNPGPKRDLKGQQRFDKVTELPMWTVRLFVLSEGNAEVMDVTVVSREMPQVAVRQPVMPVDLEALPWFNDRDGKPRHGVAFRATGLRPIETTVGG